MQFAERVEVTIASGGTNSGAIVLRGRGLFVGSVGVPTIDVGTLKFQGSYDGGATYQDLYEDSAQIGVLASSTGARIWGCAGQMAKVLGLTHLRLVAATQSADRTFVINLMTA